MLNEGEEEKTEFVQISAFKCLCKCVFENSYRLLGRESLPQTPWNFQAITASLLQAISKLQ